MLTINVRVATINLAQSVVLLIATCFTVDLIATAGNGLLVGKLYGMATGRRMRIATEGEIVIEKKIETETAKAGNVTESVTEIVTETGIVEVGKMSVVAASRVRSGMRLREALRRTLTENQVFLLNTACLHVRIYHGIVHLLIQP